ncbi:beta-xylanase [Bacteroidia bacterium]|nr:beta-xylanase [Bacteroidia bacterium]
MNKQLGKIKHNLINRADYYLYRLSNCFRLPQQNTLKNAYKDKFRIGAGINTSVSGGYNRKAIHILRQFFNAITPMDCMKMIYIQPKQGIYHFRETDEFVRFGKWYEMDLVGHSLIWGLKNPDWIFTDNNGLDISQQELVNRMQTYIHTVINRYKNDIHIWDVVNEALRDDGQYVNNRYFQILGEEYIDLAFRFAREADPDAILYYNDLKLSKETKREGTIKLIKRLQKNGIQIDGIGIQAHCNMSFPDIQELEKTIIAFSELGCKISITELDVSVLPVVNPFVDPEIALSPAYKQSLNPFAQNVPDEIAELQYKRYKDLFNLFIKYQDNIDRITLWGITDDMSGKNNFPTPGRTDYPLLFDRNYQAKPVVKDLIDMGKINPAKPL